MALVSLQFIPSQLALECWRRYRRTVNPLLLRLRKWGVLGFTARGTQGDAQALGQQDKLTMAPLSGQMVKKRRTTANFSNINALQIRAADNLSYCPSSLDRCASAEAATMGGWDRPGQQPDPDSIIVKHLEK